MPSYVFTCTVVTDTDTGSHACTVGAETDTATAIDTHMVIGTHACTEIHTRKNTPVLTESYARGEIGK